MKRGFFSVLVVTFFFVMVMQAFPDTSYGFGETWTWAKCPTCAKYYKHVGTDIPATKGKKVYITDNYYYRTKGVDSSGKWKGYIVADNPNKTGTYVVWHLTGIPNFSYGQNLKGKFIGYVADLTVTSDHIHIGYRNKPYNSSLSIKGGLPNCSHKPGGLPQYPEYWIAPWVRVSIQ